MRGKFLMDLWKNPVPILNTWPIYLWLIGGTMYVGFCSLKWESWRVREQMGVVSFDTAFDFAVGYLAALPILLGWMWHQHLMRDVDAIAKEKSA